MLPSHTSSVDAEDGLNFFQGPSAHTSDQPSTFDSYSASAHTQQSSFSPDVDDFENEPPLLEELGINFGHIWGKTLFVLLPWKEMPTDVIQDDDVAGPLVYCLLLGSCLLLTGKVHFGYIYGYGVLGCLLLNMLLNLMGGEEGIEVHRTVSILGYCLLPIVLLSGVSVFFSLKGTIGHILALVIIFWCTLTATRFIEKVAPVRQQRFLIAFPVFLLYACFALITVF